VAQCIVGSSVAVDRLLLICLALVVFSYSRWKAETQLPSNPSSISYIDTRALMARAVRLVIGPTSTNTFSAKDIVWEAVVFSSNRRATSSNLKRKMLKRVGEAMVNWPDPIIIPPYSKGKARNGFRHGAQSDSGGIDIVGANDRRASVAVMAVVARLCYPGGVAADIARSFVLSSSTSVAAD